MSRAPQKRKTETRQRLVSAAQAIVARSTLADMRVEDVVRDAQVAKGTFFSHFGDKDALMAELIGADLNDAMDRMRAASAPIDAETLCAALRPLVDVIASERIIFDVVIRYSGAAAITEIGPIAQNFIDQVYLMIDWIAPLQGHRIRADVPAPVLAEGVQAFLIQAVAMSFCAVEGQIGTHERLQTYLMAWLTVR